MKIYAIGDIHGCCKALQSLFSQLPQGAKYVFLGDYVDKGVDSKSVLEWLLNFAKTNNVIFLRGNHDILMMEARADEASFQKWIAAGGDATLKSFGITGSYDACWHQKINEKYWTFLESTIAYHVIDHWIFVHAGLEPNTPLAQQTEDYLYWKKQEIPVKYGNERIVICGHTSQKNGKIANHGHTICIDTFAYGGQWLTAFEVASGKCFQSKE